MATHIFDIDGTVVEYHTNNWLDGAKENIVQLHKQGHQIVFITMIGEHDSGTEWSIERTKETILKELNDLGVRYTVLFGFSSPRIIHDDSPVFANKRTTNESWSN